MKKVTIVGVGALGSHVALLLRNVGVTLRAIDMDRVEQKNTQSQFYGKPGVGKLKAQALQQSLDFFFGLKIQVNTNKLVAGNANELLAGSDLLLDCLDNGASRRVIQGFAREANVPCLHGALAPEGQFGRVIWDEYFVIDDETAGEAATCENGEHLPFISIVSSYLAHAAKTFLSSSGKKVGFSISPSGAISV